MKAIETTYKGYRFRNRLEARWAIFFDVLGIVWEYDREGFELEGDGAYISCFWLPFRHGGWGYWVEINPYAPSGGERDRLRKLAALAGHRMCMLRGMLAGKATILLSNYNDHIDIAETLDKFVSLFADPAGIDAAINAARSARLESGESGAHA